MRNLLHESVLCRAGGLTMAGHVHLGKVVGNIISTEKHSAYEAKKLLLVVKLDLDTNPTGFATVALDYVGAGIGDTVLVGAAPGLASVVFGVPRAPVRELIMGIVDSIETT